MHVLSLNQIIYDKVKQTNKQTSKDRFSVNKHFCMSVISNLYDFCGIHNDI